jgi:hypothetical protein
MCVLDFKLGDVSGILFWKGLIRAAGGQHALPEMLFLFLLL